MRSLLLKILGLIFASEAHGFVLERPADACSSRGDCPVEVIVPAGTVIIVQGARVDYPQDCVTCRISISMTQAPNTIISTRLDLSIGSSVETRTLFQFPGERLVVDYSDLSAPIMRRRTELYWLEILHNLEELQERHEDIADFLKWLELTLSGLPSVGVDPTALSATNRLVAASRGLRRWHAYNTGAAGAFAAISDGLLDDASNFTRRHAEGAEAKLEFDRAIDNMKAAQQIISQRYRVQFRN